MDQILAKYRYSKVLEHVKKELIVLDVGCGNGELLNKISNKIEKGFGIDRGIKERSEGNIRYLKRNIENEEFKLNEKFDVVTMVDVIEHLLHPEKVLKNVKKVMKKNGLLIITTPTPKSKPILEFMAFKLRVINESEIRDHKIYFSDKKLKKILKAAGFKELKHKHFWFGFGQIITAKKMEN